MNKHSPLWAIGLLLVLGKITLAQANSYGIYDTRTLGLAGTAVALGDSSSGHAYNPALTALHEANEDRSRDGVGQFHFVAAAVSEGAKTAVDALSDNLETRLSTAIDAFNETNVPQTAQSALTATQEFERALRDVQDKPLDIDAYTGFSLSIPAESQGGAFFIGSRFIGRGLANIQSDDLVLLNDYMEALDFIASNGQSGQAHPELLNEDNQLGDPSEMIKSSARATGALVSEVGLSLGQSLPLFNHKIYLGIAPKLIFLKSFNSRWATVEGRFTSDDETLTHQYFNFDVGLATQWSNHWQVGLAVKDIRNQTIQFSDAETLHLDSRSRLGIAYLGQVWHWGLDIDLNKTADLIKSQSHQDISVGLDYQPFPFLHCLLGYRKDLEDTDNHQATLGLQWRLGAWAMDLAYAPGDTQGASLSLGWQH